MSYLPPPPSGPPSGPPSVPPWGPPPGPPPGWGWQPPPGPPPRTRSPLPWVLGGLALLLVVVTGVVVGVVATRDGDGGDARDPAPAPASTPPGPGTPSDPVTTPTEPVSPEDAWGIALGPEDAEHTVVVYEDLLCPPCADLHAEIGGGLVERARAGEFRLVLRPITVLAALGDYSAASANALLVTRDVASVDVALALQDLLLEEQPPEQEPYPDTAWLIEKAVAAGADEDAVRPGIEDGARLADVQESMDDAMADGVTSVPEVRVDGEVVEQTGSYADLLDAIVAAVA